MPNSADPDQLASEEANWSGSALFVKRGLIWVQQAQGWNMIHVHVYHHSFRRQQVTVENVSW